MNKVKTLSDTKFEILSSETCSNRHFQIGRYLRVSCSAVAATGGRAVPCLGRLAASLSPRRAGFNPRAVHMGFVVDVLELRQVFIRRAGFNRRQVHVGFVVDRVEL